MANMEQNQIVKDFLSAEHSMTKVSDAIRACIKEDCFDNILHAATYFATEGGTSEVDSQNNRMKSLRTLVQRETEAAGNKLTFKLEDGVFVMDTPRKREPKAADTKAKTDKLAKVEEQVAELTGGNATATIDSIIRQMKLAGVTLDELAERWADIEAASSEESEELPEAA